MFDVRKAKKIINDLVEKIKNPEKIINEKDKEIKHINFMNRLFIHELNNKQTVINGYISLLAETHVEQERLNLIEKLSVSSKKIASLMEEWSRYQTAGCQIQWQTLPEIFEGCNNLHTHIKINILKNNISILSTPAIKIVMSSMVNNTAMHGGEKVNKINVDWQKSSKGVVIIIEDNGVGIPDSEKPLIFKKGFGKHTGLGLFLVKEILSITGFEITEKGTYGKGARFEISIPEGAYKLY